jgi:hypothetical protein
MYTPTIDEIAAHLIKLTNTPPNMAQRKTSPSRKIGLIKKVTANVNDKPTIQWKNQVTEKQSILKRLHTPFF